MEEEDYTDWTLKPEVSVIMSVYNSEEFLSFAIESVLDQSFRNFEFLIVNDASTDNSLRILRSYEKRDDRIRVWENPSNIGLTRSLNFLISKCTGNYVARMDADDICHLNRFQKQLDVLKNSRREIVLVGSNTEIINSSGDVIGVRRMPAKSDEIGRLMKYYNTINHPTVMIEYDILKNFGYNEKFRTSQDWDLWMRLTLTGLKCYNIQESLLKYRSDSTYFKRKDFQYRINEIKIKKENFRMFHGPIDFSLSICYTLLLAFLPAFIQRGLKKLDPRQ
jgi:glycosyltransferase involved in cell wall biosynthesis